MSISTEDLHYQKFVVIEVLFICLHFFKFIQKVCIKWFKSDSEGIFR